MNVVKTIYCILRPNGELEGSENGFPYMFFTKERAETVNNDRPGSVMGRVVEVEVMFRVKDKSEVMF